MKNLTKTFNLLLTLISTLFLFTVAAQASTFTVSNTNDSGFGSLRKAIADANSQVGSDFIHFNIAGSGVHTIILLSPLDVINGTVDIDGYTQPGASPNTLALGDNAVLSIEITTLNGAATSILNIAAPNCTIRGLVLNRSGEDGIYVTSNGGGSVITGNFIGTDATGLSARPNGKNGIHIGAANNLVGGTVPAARNIISGNALLDYGGAGILISGVFSANNKVQGNYIGTNKNGTAAIKNHQMGVMVDSQANNNTVGGTTADARNVISGNAIFGIYIFNSNFNLIEGNYIGTDVSGSLSVANTDGIDINADCFFNKVGDTVAGAGNLISGNTHDGIDIVGNNGKLPHVNQVLGNFIGTKADGTSPLGNGIDGVRILTGAPNNIVGMNAPGAPNVIAFNGADPGVKIGNGVTLADAGSGNLISGNSIYSNKSLGIDLDGQTSGVTLNDDLDVDSGPNDLQNFPVIVNATYSVINGTQIGYSLSSKANTKYTIEIFVSDTCNASGYGEGKELINTFDFSTNGSGELFLGLGSAISYLNKYITATATDPNGSTSEFSKCLQVTPQQFGNLSFSAASYSVNENGGTATITVQRTGGSDGAVSVGYATVAGGTATAGSDYVAASGTLNWAAGDNFNKTFTIPITDDAVNEPNETINLMLSNPAGGATLGIQSTATLTIVDNDTQPSLSISDVNLAEGNSGVTNFNFNVTLSAASVQTVTVNYVTGAGGTATQGTDYQPNSGTLTFAPGETSKLITVLVNGDIQDEPNETFMVQLSGPGNATISKTLGTGTIINDDAVTPSGSMQFKAASFNSNESGGQATIVVTRTGGSTGAVSVQYATVAGGTATAGSDYASTNGTLNWADGDTADKAFTIVITDDSLNESTESVNLSLSNPAVGQLGAANTAVLNISDNDAQPGLSISDVSQVEGNSGTTNFDFNVSLSATSGETVTVSYGIADGAATVGSDYQPASGTLTFAPGDTSKTITVLVNGDPTQEPDETFFVNLSLAGNATITKPQGIGKIINDDAPAAPTVQFSSASYNVQEDLGALTITVTRTGDTSGAARVDYATNDGSGIQKSDFEYVAGTLTFAPGENSKTFQVLINEDSYVEGTETVNLVLSNPNGSSLGVQSSALLSISDDAIETNANPIDDPQSFVHMHYHDFLNREPDQAGLQFWTNEITSCGQDAACISGKRTNVSAAFFLSIEFQQTAYLLYLLQKESFASLPTYNSFIRDLQKVSQGVVVNAPGWEQKIAANQQQLAREWVERPAFKAAYDSLSNTAYVNALYTNAGVVPPTAEQSTLVSKLDTASESRAEVLLDVAGNAVLRRQEQNSAFVLMEYFGYLRRDPDSGPDSDLSGYYFWLQKLNAFNGDYQQAEMVKAFITSFEYRQRFGQ